MGVIHDYPVEEWKGGKVHKIRPSVIHLMRGQVFEIDRKNIFAFGGASSHDIDGGILEPDDPYYKQKKKKLDKRRCPYRINHVSWWQQELPSEEEMEEIRQKVKFKKWFFGHYHDNRNVNAEEILLYEQMIRII